MTLLPHITSRLFNCPLMIHPGKLHAIVAGLSDRFGVIAPPMPQAYTTGTGERVPSGYRVLENGVAVLDIFGVLAHRGGFNAQSDYIQGYTQIAKGFESALADPSVRAILLNIESPGGEVSGAFQLADQIYSARGIKPIAAVASDMAASAAYLIASAADTVSVPPTGMVGSIGVVTSHVDMSRAVDAMGMQVTYIYAGKHKIDGNPLNPLSEEVAAQVQADVNYYYGLFTAAVGRHRTGLGSDGAAKTEAQMYIGQHALAARLADYLETPDQAITRLATLVPKSTSSARRAQGDSSMNLLELIGLKSKRLALDISVSDPDAPADPADPADPDDVQNPDTPPEEAPSAHPPATQPVATAPALSAVDIVIACNEQGEPTLAERVLRTPHTREQLEARLKQAKSVRAVCASVGMNALADKLVAEGATEEAAKLATWNALAARSTENPIDTTPPLDAKAKMRRSEFAKLSPQSAHSFIMSGGEVVD